MLDSEIFDGFSIQFDFFDVNIFIRLIFSFNFKRFSIFKIQSCILHTWTSDLIFIRTRRNMISVAGLDGTAPKGTVAPGKVFPVFSVSLVGLTYFAKLSNI